MRKKKTVSPVVTIENVVVSFDAGAHELHELVLSVVSSGRMTDLQGDYRHAVKRND